MTASYQHPNLDHLVRSTASKCYLGSSGQKKERWMTRVEGSQILERWEWRKDEGKSPQGKLPNSEGTGQAISFHMENLTPSQSEVLASFTIPTWPFSHPPLVWLSQNLLASTPSILFLNNRFPKQTVYVDSIYLHRPANCRQNFILFASSKLFWRERWCSSGRLPFQRPGNQQLSVLIWNKAEEMLKKDQEVSC